MGSHPWEVLEKHARNTHLAVTLRTLSTSHDPTLLTTCSHLWHIKEAGQMSSELYPLEPPSSVCTMLGEGDF